LKSKKGRLNAVGMIHGLQANVFLMIFKEGC